MQQKINLSNLFSTYSSSLVIAKDADESRPIYCVTCQDITIGDAFMEDYNYFEFEECKLALKPLSAMTDNKEHCEIIAKIIYKESYSDIGTLANFIQIASTRDFISSMKETPLMHVDYIQIIDTLRLLGYDCGYMHIPSLIEDGRYAIDINTLNKQ